jgi:hypothetical protein
MAGSIISIFTWSIFQLSSVTLVLLWAFNPLGSQASFRGIYLRGTVGSSIGNITYYNFNVTNQLLLSTYSFRPSTDKPTVLALYSAAFYDTIISTQYANSTDAKFQDILLRLGGNQSAGIQSATDSWGNLRIPHLEYHPAYNSADPHRWVDTPWTESVQNYTSLIGDEIQGVDRGFTGNTTFNITSSYQSFNVGSTALTSLKNL